LPTLVQNSEANHTLLRLQRCFNTGLRGWNFWVADRDKCKLLNINDLSGLTASNLRGKELCRVGSRLTDAFGCEIPYLGDYRECFSPDDGEGEKFILI
jgi:hypothetical protein